MGYPNSFEGFQVTSEKNWSDFKKLEIQPKPFEDYDIDVEIDACGVCGSDVHTINGGWGEHPLPLCVGHEVIGRAVKVGPKVSTVKNGDRVGVGAQVQACLKCDICKSDNENYCPHQVATYGAPYPDGTIAQGGYASHIRAHEYFVPGKTQPNNIPTEEAAPMMCAGLTTFSPLHRAKVGPGKNVAIVGIGGLGHFGILWAKALGADVYAISHTGDKEKDAEDLGAKAFINSNQKDWAKPWAFKFDYVLNCADRTEEFDLATYLSTLKINSTFHNVGVPDKPYQPINTGHFMANGCAISGSHIGSRPEMLAMLKLASEKRIKPYIETLSISEKGCKEAVERVNDDKVRYRFTLIGYDKAFPNRA